MQGSHRVCGRRKTTLIFTADAHQRITTGKSGLYVVNRTNGSGVVTDADKIAVSAVPEVVGSRAFSLGDSNADQWTANKRDHLRCGHL
ncbi:MAG: hypothetical protein ACLRWQ_16715 [Flavonifractor plautii]